MVTKIKVELEQNKKNFEFYKARNEQTPSQIYSKWVEIYADRVKHLERQLVKLEKLAAMPPAIVEPAPVAEIARPKKTAQRTKALLAKAVKAAKSKKKAAAKPKASRSKSRR